MFYYSCGIPKWVLVFGCIGLPVAMVTHGLHDNQISPTPYFSYNLAVLTPESCIFEHKKV